MSRPGPIRSASRLGGAFVVGAVVAGITLGMAADRFVSPAELEALRPPPAPTPIQGAWYCAVGETAGEDRVEVVAIGPERSSALHIESYGGGEIEPAHRLRLEPGTLQSREMADEEEGLGILGIWEDAPAVVARTWHLGEGWDVRGTVHGPCVTETSTEWYLAGVATDGGAIARLVVTNPFETDASVNIRLLTTDGPESPELLQNVGVPSRTTRTIELNEYAPERADLGAVVSLRSGRIIVEGWQSVDPAIGEIAGVSLTRLATEPAERWIVPWVPLAGAESWLTVANVGEQRAALRLVVHTADGALVGDLDEITVDEGAVQRVDLGAAFPEGVDAGGVSVISENEVPVVVSAVARIPHDDEQRTGIVHLLGHPEPHTSWVLPAVAGQGRRASLHLVNPTEENATVDVALLTPDGRVTVDALTGLDVGVGAEVVVAIDEHVPEETSVHAVLVTARTSAVATALHSYTREGRRDTVVSGGVAGTAGRTPIERRHVEPDPGMTRRLGTRLGPRTAVIDDDDLLEEPVEETEENGAP